MKAGLQTWMFLLKSLAERLAFRGTYAAALPAWLAFQRAQPQAAQWDYEVLLSSRSRYAPAPKDTDAQVQNHQAKWAGRIAHIARLFSAQKVLETGCGQGLLALALQRQGLEVHANDVLNILHPTVVEAKIPFQEGDVCQQLPYPPDSFDLVFAVNAFEHFHDPAQALDEMLRVLRPGGLVYLTFDPLYYSAWGLHARRRLGIPYPQLLFAPETIQRFVDEKRAEILATYSPSSDTTQIGPPLNGYALRQYRQIFGQRRQRMRILAYAERTCLDGLALIRQHPGLFKAQAPSFEDLLVSGIKLLGQKKSL